MTKLIDLYLDSTKVTDAGVKELQQALPKCLVLPQPPEYRPASNEVSGPITELGGVVKVNNKGDLIVYFGGGYLGAQKITDTELVHLKELTKLKELNISFTKVTDAGLTHLKGLTELVRLDLRHVKVTDAGLVHLKGLTKLEMLNLRDTKVAGAGLEHLKGLRNLESLYLYDTEVTDAGLVHLSGLTNLKYLYLGKRTKVTDAGINQLQQALPNCKIN